jgi:hypothetical protein
MKTSWSSQASALSGQPWPKTTGWPVPLDASTVDLHRLAGRRRAAVRTAAIHLWAAADGQPPGLPAQFAADPDAQVRRRVAQFVRTALGRLGSDAAELILEPLRADRAWSVHYHLTLPMAHPADGHRPRPLP